MARREYKPVVGLMVNGYEPTTDDDKHFRDNFPLIMWVVKRFATHLPLYKRLDGALYAYVVCRKNFDPSKEITWGTYFTNSFRLLMKSPARIAPACDVNLIHIPQNQPLNRISKYITRYEEMHGRTPSDVELCAEFTPNQVTAWAAHRADRNRSPTAPDTEPDLPYATHIGSGIKDPRLLPVDYQLDVTGFWYDVWSSLLEEPVVPDPERNKQIMARITAILFMRFRKNMTLEEVGAVLKVTGERVRQLERRGLDLIGRSNRMRQYRDTGGFASTQPLNEHDERELSQASQVLLQAVVDTSWIDEILEPSSVDASADEALLETCSPAHS